MRDGTATLVAEDLSEKVTLELRFLDGLKWVLHWKIWDYCKQLVQIACPFKEQKLRWWGESRVSQDEIIQDKMRKMRGWGQIPPWEELELLLVPSPTSAETLSLSADQVQRTDDNVLWLQLLQPSWWICNQGPPWTSTVMPYYPHVNQYTSIVQTIKQEPTGIW